MTTPRIGLLPFYLELYDKAMPERRKAAEKFYEQIAAELHDRGIEVYVTGLCRLRTEFEAAVTSFEADKVDAIVTLHLAYSPSLESADVLARTALPVIVLDTTPAYDFSPSQDPDEIMYNHGIHGVQDFCNLLLRRGKRFAITAGHWERSDVLDRTAVLARGTAAAAEMKMIRVGLIGRAFEGMGDFFVPYEDLKTALGIETVIADARDLASYVPAPDDPDVEAELTYDRELFNVEGLDPEVHVRSARSAIAVRRWLEHEKLDAFSMNFLAIDKAGGLPAVPFLEASKALARGVGYAGEGDVLTASLIAALASMFPETTFTEMFCPDWKNGSVFLSHMGEVNVQLLHERARIVEKPFPWTDAENPAVAVGLLKPGEACIVNLAPGPDLKFTLLIVPGEMVKVRGEDRMADTVHGWFRPRLGLADCLERYSRKGGTHHKALVYGAPTEALAGFGEAMGWEVVTIDR